ncbi:MFS transporter [Neorhizobium alkalisoli]|uniref:MFS transporter n=1 Tax=Neorhizobium alkalisoli TaxID=528178 RepID=UPI000CFA52D7|nr:MFS transporter [Neorhizobium alkalisoli]
MKFPVSPRSAQTIAVLAVTQLTGWGTTFEVLGVMGRVVAPDLGLANEVIFAGLTIMMVVSALAGPATGRLLARHGAAKVLAAGAATFALGLALLSVAHGLLIYLAAWVIIGIGGALGLSAPAYTAVVEREGQDAKRVIAILMLFTGLSITIFWPLLSVLNDLVGWRLTFAVCAALQLFVCVPLYLFALPRPIETKAASDTGHIPPVALTASERNTAFLLVAAATTISSFVTFGLSPSLLELLRQSGASPEFALQLAAARGVTGISARFVDMLLGRRGNPLITAAAGAGLMVASFTLLVAAAGSTSMLVAFILLYGFGSGVLAVARALLPLALFSPSEYGLQAARLSLPQNLANAVAPVIFTAILDRLGADILLVLCALLASLSLVIVLRLMALVRRANRRTS